MTKNVILRLEGEDRLLVVDTENLTVQAIAADEFAADAEGLESLQTIAASRRDGRSHIRGIDIAVTVSQQPQAVSAPFVAPPHVSALAARAN